MTGFKLTQKMNSSWFDCSVINNYNRNARGVVISAFINTLNARSQKLFTVPCWNYDCDRWPLRFILYGHSEFLVEFSARYMRQATSGLFGMKNLWQVDYRTLGK